MAVATSAMLRTCAVRLPAIELTLSVRSFQVPATPGTSAWPPSLPSVPTSRATRVTSAAKALSWSTIVLMVSLSCRISPLTLTVIFFERSPRATAVATSAMLRTWPVRLLAIELTLSVRSFQVPATPRTTRLAAELAVGADLAGDAGDLAGEGVELVDHGVDGLLELQDLAPDVDRDLLRQVAVGDGGRDLGDVADLGGEVARHRVDAVGQILPGAGDAEHVGLAAEPAVGADLAGDARHLAGEHVELVDHRVHGFLELQDFAAHIHRDLLRQVAAGDGGRDLGDVADLGGEVARHEVDVVGEVLPGAGDARHLRLAAELAFGADLAGDAGHFRGEGVELVHHGVDGVLELEDFAAHIDGDLAREVAARHRGRHLGDVAHLVGEVAAHGVDRIGEVLPGAGDAGHDRLTAELALGADLAGDARHLGGERAQLVDHGVDGFLELQDLAAHVDGDLLREVAIGDRDGDVGDVADLRREVARHRVDALGQILPHAGDLANLRLAAELAFGADLAGDARHLGGEDAELLDHRVDDGGRLQELALERPPVDVEGHGLQQIALRHRRDGARHRHGGPQQIVDQDVDRVLHLAPGAAGDAELDALAGPALAPDLLADALELLRDPLVGGGDLVESVGDPAGDADPPRRPGAPRNRRPASPGGPEEAEAETASGTVPGRLIHQRHCPWRFPPSRSPA